MNVTKQIIELSRFMGAVVTEDIHSQRIFVPEGINSNFWNKYKVKCPDENLSTHEFPNFINDLNAIHEVEKKLTYNQLDNYVTYLHDYAIKLAKSISPTSDAISVPWGQFAICANAMIRTKALLIAIGKWEGEA